MKTAECITVVCDVDKIDDLKRALRAEEEPLAGDRYVIHIFPGYWSDGEDAEPYSG